LTDLYGSVDGSRKPNITSTDEGNNATALQSTGNRRRQLRYSHRFTKLVGNMNQRQLFSSVTDKTKRRELLKRWDEINSSVLNGLNSSDLVGWRLLHRTEFGEAHEMELDDVHTVQLHFLLA
jgi:hypothetical protein